MVIASVVQGTIETELGKVFELDSPKGSAWLETVTSFRYVPTGASKPYTVRKEPKKGGDYWYGYRKQFGKLHKRYIGKTTELTLTKLEEIAETLNTPQQPRVVETVTEVTQTDTQGATDTVTDNRVDDRLSALEAQIKALQESLEVLRGELLGESQTGETLELLKNNAEVAENRLLTQLGNSRTENEALWQEVQELRSQLATERASREEITNLAPIAIGAESPDAADLLNQLKAKRKKSTASLADIEALLEMMGQ